MPIKVGDKMPSGTLTLATVMQKVSADDYFKGKKVVLFSVPGAFTPATPSTCRFVERLPTSRRRAWRRSRACP